MPRKQSEKRGSGAPSPSARKPGPTHGALVKRPPARTRRPSSRHQHGADDMVARLKHLRIAVEEQLKAHPWAALAMGATLGLFVARGLSPSAARKLAGAAAGLILKRVLSEFLGADAPEIPESTHEQAEA